MKTVTLFLLIFVFTNCENKLSITPNITTVGYPKISVNIVPDDGNDSLTINKPKAYKLYLKQLEFSVPTLQYKMRFTPTAGYDAILTINQKEYRPNDWIISPPFKDFEDKSITFYYTPIGSKTGEIDITFGVFVDKLEGQEIVVVRKGLVFK